MVIYKPGDVLSRQDCSLKTASRLGNIKRKILFQNTNGKNTSRDDVVKGESLGDSILAFLGVGRQTPALAVA